MVDIVTFCKHISYTSSPEVHKICLPLFESFNLNFFDYARTYKDGTCIVLISDDKWYKQFFAQQYSFGTTILNPGLYFWSIYPKAMEADARNNFNHAHGITIVKECNEYLEQYDFAAPVDNSNAINFYLNNMDILEQFMLYFKDKAEQLVQLSEQQRIIILKYQWNRCLLI